MADQGIGPGEVGLILDKNKKNRPKEEKPAGQMKTALPPPPPPLLSLMSGSTTDEEPTLYLA